MAQKREIHATILWSSGQDGSTYRLGQLDRTDAERALQNITYHAMEKAGECVAMISTLVGFKVVHKLGNRKMSKGCILFADCAADILTRQEARFLANTLKSQNARTHKIWGEAKSRNPLIAMMHDYSDKITAALEDESVKAIVIAKNVRGIPEIRAHVRRGDTVMNPKTFKIYGLPKRRSPTSLQPLKENACNLTQI